MDINSELKLMWDALTGTTKGYRQMAKPLVPPSNWYTAQQHYLNALALSTPVVPPDPVPVPPDPIPVPPVSGGGSIPAKAGVMLGAFLDGDQTYTHYYGGTWGDAPWDLNTWNRFETNAGRRLHHLHWGMSPPFGHDFTYWKGTLDSVEARGARNMISISTGAESLAAMAAGSRDAYWTTFAQQAKTYGKPFFFRPNWEMNGTWYEWGKQAAANPADYVAWWRRTHDIFKTNGATNVVWLWCPNVIFSGSTDLSKLYPGDPYVDWLAVDGYNDWSTSRDFLSIYQPTYNQFQQIAPGKPIMICEISSFEFGGAKAAWTTDTFNKLKSGALPNVHGLTWFNWRITENGVTKEWPIESSAAATAAYKNAVADQTFFIGRP